MDRICAWKSDVSNFVYVVCAKNYDVLVIFFLYTINVKPSTHYPFEWVVCVGH